MLKKFLIVLFFLIFQVNSCVLAEDITEDAGYKNVMDNIRQRNVKEQIQLTQKEIEPPDETIIPAIPNPSVSLIDTIRDKDEVVLPEQPDIFMPEDIFTNTAPEQDDSLYSDDFVEDIEEVTPLSESITTAISQDDYNKKSDNNIGLWVICIIVVLYFIIGWNLDFDKVSSDDSVKNNNTNQQKKVTKNQNYHITETNIINKEETSYWQNIKDEVYEIYGRECCICGSRLNINIHHKIPLNDGGTSIIENLVPLCRDCHEKMHSHKFKNDEDYIIDDNYGRYVKKDKMKEKGYLISSAIKNHYKLKIRYKKKDFKNNKIIETTRVISPKNIKLACEIKNNKFINKSDYDNRKNIVFIEAYCYLRKAERLFRLDRLEVLEVIKGYS